MENKEKQTVTEQTKEEQTVTKEEQRDAKKEPLKIEK